MKKVNILLALAFLFITGVLILVMFQGVSLKERRIVEWSSISSIDQGTGKIANFFFPILKQWKVINIHGEPKITPKVFQSFKNRAHEISPETKIIINAPTNRPEQFEIVVTVPKKEKSIEECKKGSKEACVALKALRKFGKKERDSGQIWISLYRINDSKILFLVIPAE